MTTIDKRDNFQHAAWHSRCLILQSYYHLVTSDFTYNNIPPRLLKILWEYNFFYLPCISFVSLQYFISWLPLIARLCSVYCFVYQRSTLTVKFLRYTLVNIITLVLVFCYSICALGTSLPTVKPDFVGSNDPHSTLLTLHNSVPEGR